MTQLAVFSNEENWLVGDIQRFKRIPVLKSIAQRSWL